VISSRISIGFFAYCKYHEKRSDYKIDKGDVNCKYLDLVASPLEARVQVLQVCEGSIDSFYLKQAEEK